MAKTVDFFRKMPYRRCLIGFQIRLWPYSNVWNLPICHRYCFFDQITLCFLNGDFKTVYRRLFCLEGAFFLGSSK